MKITVICKRSLSLLIMISVVMLTWTTGSYAKTIKLNYSWFAPNSEAHYQVVQYFIKEIEERTQGRVKITYFPAGSLVGGPQAYDAVSKGISDIDFPVMAYTPARFPVCFAWDLPLGIKSSAAATQMMIESYEKFKPKELDGVKILYLWGSPPCQLQVKKEMNSMTDIVGRKIRCTGITAEFIRALGGTPVSLPMSGAYESLQKGVVEGTINSTNALKVFKLGELLDYEYEINALTVPFICVMNQKKWQSLPADIQKIISEVSQECIPLETKVWNESVHEGRMFGEEKGMQFIKATPEMFKEIETVQPVLYQNYLDNLKKLGLEKEGKAFLDYLIAFSKSDKNK